MAGGAAANEPRAAKANDDARWNISRILPNLKIGYSNAPELLVHVCAASIQPTAERMAEKQAALNQIAFLELRP